MREPSQTPDAEQRVMMVWNSAKVVQLDRKKSRDEE